MSRTLLINIFSSIFLLANTVSYAESRYIDNHDGTVTDTKNKLMWMQCSIGFYGGTDCNEEEGAAVYKRDYAVEKFSKGFNFAGYSDWRMPTKEELGSLVYCSNGTPQEIALTETCARGYNEVNEYQHPTIDLKIFPATEMLYWSSTQENDSSNWDSWAIDFYDGHGQWYSHHVGAHVRLVRFDSR